MFPNMTPKPQTPKMHLEVLRFHDNGKRTLGTLLLNGKPMCYTLEDEERTVKVWGETRIPEGTYKLGLRKEGGHHTRYSEKFPGMHKGMLHVLDVPNFTHILIHIGNSEDDTAGCLLPAMRVSADYSGVTHSTQAYKSLYPPVAKAIEDGYDVTITYRKVYP